MAIQTASEGPETADTRYGFRANTLHILLAEFQHAAYDNTSKAYSKCHQVSTQSSNDFETVWMFAPLRVAWPGGNLACSPSSRHTV